MDKVVLGEAERSRVYGAILPLLSMLPAEQLREAVNKFNPTLSPGIIDTGCDYPELLVEVTKLVVSWYYEKHDVFLVAMKDALRNVAWRRAYI